MKVGQTNKEKNFDFSKNSQLQMLEMNLVIYCVVGTELRSPQELHLILTPGLSIGK